MNSATVKSLSDQQLIERTEYLARRERAVVEYLIWHLQEIQDRKLFILMGYTSLFECLVKHFKYSEPVAYTRMSALKIMSAVPEAAGALNSGEVSLTTLSLTQSFIRKQEKETGEKISLEQKIQYLESIKNRSAAEVKKVLATIHPVAELPLDKVHHLTSDHAQLQVVVDNSTLEKIEKLKSLISHENIDPSYNEIFNLSLDLAIKEIEKKKGINTTGRNLKMNASVEAASSAACQDDSHQPLSSQLSTQSFSGKSSRYVSRDIKRTVLSRSNGQCEHIHSNGQRCSSKFQIEFDHILAFSKGGGAGIDNIQSLCRVHNQNKGAN